jgi:hypothetical protein
MKDPGSGIPNLVKATEEVVMGRKLTGKVGVQNCSTNEISCNFVMFSETLLYFVRIHNI